MSTPKEDHVHALTHNDDMRKDDRNTMLYQSIPPRTTIGTIDVVDHLPIKHWTFMVISDLQLFIWLGVECWRELQLDFDEFEQLFPKPTWEGLVISNWGWHTLEVNDFVEGRVSHWDSR